MCLFRKQVGLGRTCFNLNQSLFCYCLLYICTLHNSLLESGSFQGDNQLLALSHFVVLTLVSVTFLVIVQNTPKKTNLREQRFILVHSSRAQSSLVGAAWPQESEAAGHVVSTARKQRDKYWWCWAWFFLFIQSRTPACAMHRQSGSSYLKDSSLEIPYRYTQRLVSWWL